MPGHLETSFAPDGTIGVRDSTNPTAPVLGFTADEWIAFVAGVKGGEFDDTSTSR